MTGLGVPVPALVTRNNVVFGDQFLDTSCRRSSSEIIARLWPEIESTANTAQSSRRPGNSGRDVGVGSELSGVGCLFGALLSNPFQSPGTILRIYGVAVLVAIAA